MKKNHLLLFVLMVVVALSSCTNKDYQKAIPANATLVMKVDVNSISEKADFKNSKVKFMLDAALASMAKSEDVKGMKEYMNDPQKMGFDLSMPLYLFMVGEETVGLTMKMGDEGDVKDFLMWLNKQGAASKPIEKDGLACGTLMDDIHYAYDSKTFLMLASLKGQTKANTSRMVRELMSLKDADSFSSTEAFSRMDGEDGDVVAYTNGKVLGKDILAEMKKGLMPSSLDANEMDALLELNFEDGKASFTTKIWGKTEKAQALIDEADKNFSKIEGKYLDRVADNMYVWIGTNVKGEWALGKLKEMQSVKEALFMMERAIDIEQMLKAVDGDMAFELQIDDLENGQEPEYIFYGDLKNSDFLADVEDWTKTMTDYGMTMEEKGKNQYVLTMDDASYQWGVQDKDLYFSSLGVKTKNKGTSPLAAYKDDIQKNKFYAVMDLTRIPWNTLVGQSPDMAVLKGALGRLQSIVVKSASTDEVTLTIELKDKDENFLKQLLK